MKMMDQSSYIEHNQCNLVDSKDNPEQALLKKEKYNGLSSEAKLVFKMLVEAPSDTASISIKAVTRNVRENLGWQWKVIQSAVQEIKEYLS